MNDEQNDIENGSETEDTATKGTTAPGGKFDLNDPSAQPEDNYYDVDHAKKDVISTVGDGEMHNEGLVGAGEDTTTDLQSSTERLSDEQDEAELHDSEQ